LDDHSFLLDLRAGTTTAVMARLFQHAAEAGFPIVGLGTLPTPEYPYADDFVLANCPEAWVAEYFGNG
jgi:hypothetical protein